MVKILDVHCDTIDNTHDNSDAWFMIFKWSYDTCASRSSSRQQYCPFPAINLPRDKNIVRPLHLDITFTRNILTSTNCTNMNLFWISKIMLLLLMMMMIVSILIVLILSSITHYYFLYGWHQRYSLFLL